MTKKKTKPEAEVVEKLAGEVKEAGVAHSDSPAVTGEVSEPTPPPVAPAPTPTVEEVATSSSPANPGRGPVAPSADELLEQDARSLFDAYNAEGPNAGLTWDGKPVPTWEKLNDSVRGKWRAAAKRGWALTYGEGGHNAKLRCKCCGNTDFEVEAEG